MGYGNKSYRHFPCLHLNQTKDKAIKIAIVSKIVDCHLTTSKWYLTLNLRYVSYRQQKDKFGFLIYSTQLYLLIRKLKLLLKGGVDWSQSVVLLFMSLVVLCIVIITVSFIFFLWEAWKEENEGH